MRISERIRFTGTHARILKKYSRDKQSDEQVKFIVQDADAKDDSIFLFDTMIDCFMFSTILGLVEDKIAEENNDQDSQATIFADIINKRTSDIERLFNHMFLSSKDLPVADAIKLSFGTNEKPVVDKCTKDLLSYSRGGLEYIDDHFKNAGSYEDLLFKILEFIKHFSN